MHKKTKGYASGGMVKSKGMKKRWHDEIKGHEKKAVR